MLAYVFWHWPQAGVAPAVYEARLVEFHSALAAHKPPGYHRSAAFRVKGADWLGSVTEAYEEWYLMDGSAALDQLNDAALAPACRAAHDAAARLAAGGTAGLYRLRAGAGELESARLAHWLSKPSGTKYQEFYESLKALTDRSGVALWGRQMVLGPTREFCLLAPSRLELPATLAAHPAQLEPLQP